MSNRCFRYYSSLYVTGDKASKTYSVLTPHIDFEERIANRSELVKNIKSRNLNIELEKVESRWKFYKHLRDQKIVLQNNRNEISQEITKLLKDPEKNKDEIIKLKLHAESAKNDLVNLKDFLYGVEEAAALHALSLPNKLHEKTPLENELIIKKAHYKNTATKCHSEVSPQFFKFATNPNLVYLLEDAALFEQSLCNYLQEKLLKIEFLQISNPNFCTGVIHEGCANQNHKTFKINADSIGVELFLTGSASLNAFMAYFARLQLKPTQIPQKLFTIGKLYENVSYKKESFKNNLFNLSQTAAVDIFCILKDHSSSDVLCKELCKLYFQIYDELQLNIQCVLLPAKDLKLHESLCYSFQMFSNHLQKFVEIGNISISDDFLSKRLLLSYDENKSRIYAHLLSGTVLNVHKTLGCLIENNEITNEAIMTETLKPFLYN